MSNRAQPSEWLASFVVPDPPRGTAARALAQELVDALDSPQDSAPAVHIVGTAGKGSVASRLTARLVAAGFRVATHQSPHVYDIRERFMIDGELPEWSAVEAAIEEVAAAVDVVERAHGARPTFFAVTAALSWVLGRRHGVDVFVIEAGIGGRNDATSVLGRSDTLTVVTRIGLDHTEVLGSTVSAIAAEKAAVMAGRGMAVLGPQTEPEAVRVVREIARAEGNDLWEVTGAFLDWRAEADATADRAATQLEATLGRTLPAAEPGAIPGRMEARVCAGRRIVLDGAHNPVKLQALAEALRADAPAVVVAAVGAAKDLDGCAAGLAAFGAPIIAIEFGGSSGPRSREAAEFVDAVEGMGGRGDVAVDAADAARRAVAETAPGATVLVTGSFLILGDVIDAFEALDVSS